MDGQKSPRDQEVGRILIEETVEEAPKELRRITDKSQKKETTTFREYATDIQRTDVKDIQGTYVQKEEKRFGPRGPEEQFLPEIEKLDRIRKVRLGLRKKCSESIFLLTR